MDWRMIKALGFKPLISLSMVMSIALISFLKVSMQLNELAIETLSGSYKALSRR